MKDFVTEKEAATKRCPRIPSISEFEPQNCLGSQCMFWRWSHQDNGPTADPTGFCGQAGLPKYI